MTTTIDLGVRQLREQMQEKGGTEATTGPSRIHFRCPTAFQPEWATLLVEPQPVSSRSGRHWPINCACPHCSRVFSLREDMKAKEALAELYHCLGKHVEHEHPDVTATYENMGMLARFSS